MAENVHMEKRWPRTLIVLVAAALTGVAMLVTSPGPDPARAGTCTDADAPPAPLAGHPTATEAETALRCLINNERKSRGLKVMYYNGKLSTAAQNHSTSMDNFNYWSHNSRNGSSFVSRIKATGYILGTVAWTVGENIAWGYRYTPRNIFNGWMNSSTHREQLLKSSYRDIGIGLSWGSPTGSFESGSAIYTADFGRRWY
jgi:uncharacterized protein YkwD